MKFSNCLSGALLFSLSSASFLIYSYPGLSSSSNDQKPSTLDSFNELSYLLYDKINVGDYLNIGATDFDKLKKLNDQRSSSANIEGYLSQEQGASNNGHLVVIVNNGGNTIKSLLAEASSAPLFEVESDKKIDGIKDTELLELLLTKHDDLQVKLNQPGAKVVSNVASSGDEEREYRKLKLYQQQAGSKPLSVNEKALIEVALLGDKFFPKKVFSISNDDDKTYGVLRLDLDATDYEVGAIVEQNLFELVRQASERYDIDSTIVVNSDRKIAVVDNNSNYKRAKSESKGNDKKKKGSSHKSTFASEEECIFNTNNCHTHGLCSKNSVSGKWSCLCAASFNETSKSTTHWSGSSCNKIDISAEFNLLFWSSLVLLVTVIGATTLVFKMDSEPLPGILSAATSQSFKN